MKSSGFNTRVLVLAGGLALALAALLFILPWTAGDPAIAQDDTQAEKPARPTGLALIPNGVR